MRVLGRRMAAVALVGGVVTVASGQNPPPIARYVPSTPDVAHVFVLDSAHLLSPAAVRMLQDSSRALQTETAADVAWVTLPTLGGRPIEEAALYIGRTWRIGSAGQAGDPLRNRGLVVLFIPDKRTTAGSNFRIEVGNGLEGTITDSRSRTISAAMREALRAKHYDAAYQVGWQQAASLVREDFATYGATGRVAAQTAQAQHTVRVLPPVAQPAPESSFNLAIPLLFLVVVVVFVFVLIKSRGRGLGGVPIILPVGNTDDDDEKRRATPWLSTNGGGFGTGGDSGGSSSSDGGSFGDGGGFSGGGSSDTI